MGSWHSAAYAGERMPTLRQVLAQFLEQKQLCVELKMHGNLDADPLIRCRRTDAGRRGVRLLGVAVSGFTENASGAQLDLFDT